MEQRPARVLRPVDREFWAHVDQDHLSVQRCDDCSTFTFPPTEVCPECLATTLTWVAVEGEAVVRSWTTISRRYFAEISPPVTVVAAELPEGPFIAADLDGAPDQLQLDESVVKLVFSDAEFADGHQGRVYRWQLVPGEAPPP